MAQTVTDILAEILTDQARRTIDGQDAARRILLAVRREILADIAAFPAESYSTFRQQQLLASIDRQLADAEAQLRADISRGISGSWEAGRDLLPAMARSGSSVTLSIIGIAPHLVDQIKEFAWGRITAVRNDAVAKIRAEITLGLLGQKTPQEIAGAVAGTLERPGVFGGVAERAEVIVKTEMGRAFTMAHQASMESAVDTLPSLKKMWLHAGHPKQPRPFHLRLSGDVKEVDQPFLVGNIAMRYPRDPKAPASEIINCGCMHVAWMPEWGSKSDYLKSWNRAQKAANTINRA